MMKLLEKEKEIEDLSEADLKEMVRFACVGASLSTTKYGGLNSVPTYEEVISYLK